MADPTSSQPEDTSIGHRAASGVIWLTAQKWIVRIAGLVTIAILTRLLSPEDFGVVAAATTVLPFFYLISDLGFATYIVQADEADRRTLSTGFWFSATAGIVLTAILIVGAPVFGMLFGSDDLVPVLRALSIAVILTAVASVPTALLRRRLQFRALALQGLVASIIAQVVAVALAFGGQGVWALVGQTVASQFVMSVLACVAARWLPSWMFSWREFVAMARFGTKVLGVELVAMTRTAVEAAIITSALGLTAFGYLSIAQKLVQIVQDLTGAAVLPVTMAAFAKVRESSERLVAAYTRALRMIYAVMAPPLVLVAVTAPLVIPIVFGPGWDESFRVAQFLALAGTVVVGATLDHGLFYGLGKPGRWFVYALVVDILTVAVTALAVQQGLVAVAIGFLIVAVVATLGRWFLVAGLIKTPVSALARPFLYLVTTVVVSGGAGYAVSLWTTGIPPILSIIVTGIVIAGVHAGITAVLARPVFADALGYLSKMRGSRAESLPSDKETS